VVAVPMVLAAGALSACDVLPELDLTVTSTVDARDIAPGDGVCEATAGAGDCTLRAAIDEANAASPLANSSVHILLGAATYDLTLSGTDDTNATGDLDLHAAVPVVVGGDGRSIIHATGDGALDVSGGALVLLRVGITGGTTGVVLRDGAIGVVSFSSIHDDQVGVAARSSATVHLDQSTVAANATAGVAVDGATFTGSFATIDAGAKPPPLGSSFGITATNAPGSSVDLTASFVDSCDAPASLVHSSGYNATSTSTNSPPCPFTQPTDIVSGADLVDHGESAQAAPFDRPEAGSPLVDAVPVGVGGCVAGVVDQRLVARPIGARCDIGAVELEPPRSFTVDTSADLPDAAPGDGACATSGGTCSLRAAIDEADLAAADVTVTIAPGVSPTITLAGQDDDANATGDFDIDQSLTLHGNGATIDAAHLDRVLDQHGGTLHLDHATIAHGDHVGSGGGILAAGRLDLTRVSISANRAAIPNRGCCTAGGGLALQSGEVATSTFLDVDVRGNTVGIDGQPFQILSESGGGVDLGFNSHGTRPALVWHSGVIDGNSVPGGSGGAIFGTGLDADHLTISNNVGTLGAVTIGRSTIDDSTITGSSGGIGAIGIFGDIMVTNSTIAGNAEPDARGTGPGGTAGGVLRYVHDTVRGLIPGQFHTSVGSILEQDTTDCTINQMSQQPVTFIDGSFNLVYRSGCPPQQLGSLADNGGPTLTALPVPGSLAVDAIPVGTAGLCDATTPPDQRGITRPQGTACDIGAVEVVP
jgi:CSLREA domain-containing protein